MPWYNPYRTPTGDRVSPGGHVVRFPVYLLWSVWGFAISWSETREYRRLGEGLPAVLMAAVLILLFVWQGRPASREMVLSYHEKARQATRNEQFELADFYFRKLELLAPGDVQIRYDHALLHEAREDYAATAQIMEQLVRDDDQSDDARAHVWLAQAALEGRLTVDDPLAYAKHHLNQLLEEQPNHQQAHYFYAQLFLRMNDLDNAIRHLEPIANQLPELRMQLASLYYLRGDQARSRMLAKEAADLLEQQIRDRQTTDVTIWLRLADSYILLKDFERAVSTLKQALTKFENDPCRHALARAYVLWSDNVIAQNPENVGRRMELLQEALQVAPDQPLALQRIVEISGGDGPAAQEAKAQLQQALADGRGTAVVHFALGTLEASKGNMDAALRHLDQAHAANPHTAVTLNNLAFVIAHSASPDLERALNVSNQAIRIGPNVASFRETRGQILTKMGRYADAITDLEFALPKISRVSTRIQIHQSLATCYRELGDADLARIHEEKAAQLERELPAVIAPSDVHQKTIDALEQPLSDEESP